MKSKENDQNKINEDNQVEKTPFVQLVRKVMLAGIGAAALAQEEAEDFVNKLIEKGELAEKEGWTILKDLRDKRKEKSEQFVEKRISTFIERFNIPTKSDYKDLSKKINELSKKIDNL